MERWLADACEVAVPALWIYEVGNVVGLKQPDHALELMGAMTSLGLPESAPETFLADALRLKKDRRVTFYDAAYHATALVRDGVSRASSYFGTPKYLSSQSSVSLMIRANGNTCPPS